MSVCVSCLRYQLASTRTVESPSCSLELLLTSFFEEMDRDRVRMAGVYGSRYAGHEDRLFAELTRRYGKESVAVLERRFEEETRTASSSRTVKDRSAGDKSVDSHQASLETESSGQDFSKLKTATHGESPPTWKVATTTTQLGCGNGRRPSGSSSSALSVPTPHVVTDEADGSRCPSVAAVTTRDVFSERESEARDVPASPRKQHLEKPPRSPQRVSPQPRVSTAGIAVLKTSVPPSTASEPNSGHDSVRRALSSNQSGEQLRTSASVGKSAGSETRAIEPITLEALLRVLYKKHQPDKVESASQVAKAYAGKERELVRLLKAKYGALSVKRLEENLSLLEATSTARDARKKPRYRGRIVRGVLLTVVTIAVSVAALAVLNSRVCQRTKIPDHVNEATCSQLSADLNDLSLAKASAAVRESYSLECFCVEWEEREGDFVASASGASAARLAQMLPFSRTTVETFLADTRAYAKPLVELSRRYTSDFQSVVARVVSELSKRFVVLHTMTMGLSEQPAPLDPVGRTARNESNASALTKVAQASKLLLGGLREQRLPKPASATPMLSETPEVASERISVVQTALSAAFESAVVEVEICEEAESIFSDSDVLELASARLEAREVVGDLSLSLDPIDKVTAEEEPEESVATEPRVSESSTDAVEGGLDRVSSALTLSAPDAVAGQASVALHEVAGAVSTFVVDRTADLTTDDSVQEACSSSTETPTLALRPDRVAKSPAKTPWDALLSSVRVVEITTASEVVVVVASEQEYGVYSTTGVCQADDAGEESGLETPPSGDDHEAAVEEHAIAFDADAASVTLDSRAAERAAGVPEDGQDTSTASGVASETSTVASLQEPPTDSSALQSSPLVAEASPAADAGDDDDDDWERIFASLDPWELLERANERAAATASTIVAATHLHSALEP